METAQQISELPSLKEADRDLTAAGAPFEIEEIEIGGQKLRAAAKKRECKILKRALKEELDWH